MNTNSVPARPTINYFVNAENLSLENLAKFAFQSTCRSDLNAPGFCLINFGSQLDSSVFRKSMVDLKNKMTEIQEQQSDQTLIYLSAMRFDQQVSTKPHLDGGPEECFLMLGYEPSAVKSEVQLIDYSKCAYDLALTPMELMNAHNPMFKPGYDLMLPYAINIDCFSESEFQILLINNSFSALSEHETKWQGVLHTATIPNPDLSKRRVINSTMIEKVPKGTEAVLSREHLRDFVSTSKVIRRGNDLPELKDDN